jgi:hypothetical protein
MAAKLQAMKNAPSSPDAAAGSNAVLGLPRSWVFFTIQRRTLLFLKKRSEKTFTSRDLRKVNVALPRILLAPRENGPYMRRRVSL